MTELVFGEQVRSAAERVAELRARAATADDERARELLAEGLEELAVAFEELQVAQEELHVQNEVLLASEVVAMAERNRYRELFEFAPNGYLVTNADGVIQVSNLAARDLFGISGPRYLVNKPLAVLIVAADRGAFLTQLSELQRGEAAWSQTLRVQPRPEGTGARVVDLTVVPFRDPETRRPMLRWQLRDVTEQWKATEALRIWNDELERRVRERTRELEQAEQQLKELDRRKDEYLAVLAHELRNMLTPIRYASHALQRKIEIHPDARRAVDTIARQVRQMAQLVDDLMDTSCVVQGKVRLSPEPLDAARVVADAAEGVRLRAVDRGIRVETVASDRPVWVTADPTRLDQVLANLLSNALKYCGRGDAIMLWVDEEADRAAIHIRDTGAGIAAEMLPVLFNLFSQGGAPVDRTQSGLGIGLHLVKQLIELHGGTVEALSEGPNRGSEFVIRLPLGKPPGEAVLPSPRAGE